MGELTRKSVVAGVLAVLAVSLGVGVGMLRRAPHPVATAEPTVSQTLAEMIDVHVAGWVVAPGVVSVRRGSIVADAIGVAGGLRPGAAVESINLAAEVSAGQQIVVPQADSASATPDVADGLIALNLASASELEELPGVGPVLAERIVSFRDQNGPFERVESLLEVPGIGEAKLSSIRDLVRP